MVFPKKCRLGPQNGFESLGPEKLSKIVNCAETKKLKETMVGPQVEYVGGHQYPPGSVIDPTPLEEHHPECSIPKHN